MLIAVIGISGSNSGIPWCVRYHFLLKLAAERERLSAASMVEVLRPLEAE